MEKEILSELRKLHDKLDAIIAVANKLWPELIPNKGKPSRNEK